jgi:hypothetical protein
MRYTVKQLAGRSGFQPVGGMPTFGGYAIQRARSMTSRPTVWMPVCST